MHLCLLDGSAMVHRAFHAVKTPIVTRDGVPANALVGFTQILARFCSESRSTHMALVFDVAPRSFRHDLYPDYKANRPPPPEALVRQLPLVREMVKALGVASPEDVTVEADDVIAAYTRVATANGARVSIVSSDKDLMQLVSPTVNLYCPTANRVIGPGEVETKFGVPPERLTTALALCGDPVDNIPGAPGVGIKIAARLTRHFGDIDTLYERIGEVRLPLMRLKLIEAEPAVRLSYALVRLKDDISLPLPLAALRRAAPDWERAASYAERHGLDPLAARLRRRSGTAAA